MTYTNQSSGGNVSVSYSYLSYFVNNDGTKAPLQQSFSFSTSERQISVGSSSFSVPASTVKWTILVNTTFGFTNGLTIRYALTDLASQGSPATSAQINSSTENGITTYYLPLVSTFSNQATIAQVQVLDFAFADGIPAPIDQSILSSNSTFVLVMKFPPFASTLAYDPAIGLGVLLGSKSSSDGGGSANLGLIIGVAVGGSIAVLFVITIIVLGSVFLGKRMRNPSAGAVNFDDETEHDHGAL